jgi:Pyridoxamine 5'-phosphate oxidase
LSQIGDDRRRADEFGGRRRSEWDNDTNKTRGTTMPELQTVAERNIAGYDLPMVDWGKVQEALAGRYPQAPGTGGPDRHTAWLTTINADGSPHVRPFGLGGVDGTWYLVSGPGTQKSRNLARDPRCTVSIATQAFDLVIEGRAERVTDAAELSTVVQAFNAEGWPARVEGDAFTAEYSAPSAGPPPWYVYRVVPSTVHAFGTTEPGGAARFDVAAG